MSACSTLSTVGPDSIVFNRQRPARESSGRYRQHSFFRQKLRHDNAGLVLPFRQLALEAVIAAGNGDQFANVAARDELVTERDGLDIGHGRVGIAMKDQYWRHLRVQLMHWRERFGFV